MYPFAPMKSWYGEYFVSANCDVYWIVWPCSIYDLHHIPCFWGNFSTILQWCSGRSTRYWSWPSRQCSRSLDTSNFGKSCPVPAERNTNSRTRKMFQQEEANAGCHPISRTLNKPIQVVKLTTFQCHHTRSAVAHFHATIPAILFVIAP